MISNTDNFRKKLLFRSSHRGTKEMDILLGGFFKEFANSLDESELVEFQSLLELTDKVLSDWLIMNKTSESIEKFRVSKKIKEFVNSNSLIK